METVASGITGAEAMFARDRASRALGMRVLEAEPGHAVVEMVVREDMLNGYEVAHGAFVFAVADTAFAIACNETDAVTLAAGADITFLRPGILGRTLVATADRRSLAGRSGVYDVQVVDGTGVIAEFRGRSRMTSRAVPGAAPTE